MPTMHGTGIHHYIQKKNKWKTVTIVRDFLARLLHNDTEKMIHFFDKCIAVVGLIGPIMTTPQIMTVWVHHQTAGLALTSWSTYVFTSTFWLFYGILHKERAIIIVNIAWILSNLSVVTGILVFR